MGRPVKELQRTMTRHEFVSWCAYVELYGPIDMSRRYDQPAARIAFQINRANGGKADMDAFLPYQPKPSADLSDVDLQVMKAFGIKHG